MRTVRMDRLRLLAILKQNREEHREIFLEAQEGYRAAAIKELDAMLSEAREGKRIRRSLSLVAPVDQTREYDNAIEMLEMSVDDKIEITEQDFRCYVKDEWNWKGQFLSSNAAYSAKALTIWKGGGDD